jgi:hypothetical protein
LELHFNQERKKKDLREGESIQQEHLI